MIIQMTTKEFQEFRKIIVELKNPKATKAFNKVFSKSSEEGVKGFVNPLNKDVIINIPEHLSIEVEKVLVKHSPALSKLSNHGVSITSAPKWISSLKTLWSDITEAITNK